MFDHIAGTYERTIFKFLGEGKKIPYTPWCHFEDGKLLVGTETTHRTRAGVRYNKLITLYYRTHK